MKKFLLPAIYLSLYLAWMPNIAFSAGKSSEIVHTTCDKILRMMSLFETNQSRGLSEAANWIMDTESGADHGELKRIWNIEVIESANHFDTSIFEKGDFYLLVSQSGGTYSRVGLVYAVPKSVYLKKVIIGGVERKRVMALIIPMKETLARPDQYSKFIELLKKAGTSVDSANFLADIRLPRTGMRGVLIEVDQVDSDMGRLLDAFYPK